MTIASRMARLAFPATLLGLTALAGAVHAEEPPSFALSIKDHQFSPAEIEVPKGTKVKLVVKNLDPTPEEFESDALHREKVVGANGEITVLVGPLEPGRYEFYGDFNPKTARGALIVKP